MKEYQVDPPREMTSGVTSILKIRRLLRFMTNELSNITSFHNLVYTRSVHR
jgi:hypothetical protein